MKGGGEVERGGATENRCRECPGSTYTFQKRFMNVYIVS